MWDLMWHLGLKLQGRARTKITNPELNRVRNPILKLR
jgi:hypothetical protein